MVGKPRAIVNTCLFLTNEENDFINGVNIKRQAINLSFYIEMRNLYKIIMDDIQIVSNNKIIIHYKNIYNKITKGIYLKLYNTI